MEDSYAKVERARRDYEKSEKGKAKNKRYNLSDKGKASRDKYLESEKGKAAVLRYNLSDKAEVSKQKRKGRVDLFQQIRTYQEEHPSASIQEALEAIAKEEE